MRGKTDKKGYMYALDVYIPPHTGSDVRKKFGSSDALRFALSWLEADIIHITKGRDILLSSYPYNTPKYCTLKLFK